ncbi:hypothetical protein ACWXVJ_00545 [Mycoplasma sp. 773]
MPKKEIKMLSAKELYNKYKLATQEEVYEIIKQNTKDLIRIILEEEIKKHLVTIDMSMKKR